ncbi:MAG TPA: DUF1844 domain-containing protein [Pyrinomonadaceae bacterium]|nr:DUF1844 domain-containing protein [Pyrinomonadaceae bacterium]
MSEEKPTFKITDRRLFNPDGSPRDIVREEKEEPLKEATAPRPAPPDESASAGAPRASAEESARDVRADSSRSEFAGPPPSQKKNAREREAPAAQAAEGAEDFLMLVEFLASFAADALGMVNHPGGGGVNLQLAKQCIDMLGTLRDRTRGNLSGEEEQFLEMILSQLRMQYVSLTSAPRPPQGGRGFTGGDITGGR